MHWEQVVLMLNIRCVERYEGLMPFPATGTYQRFIYPMPAAWVLSASSALCSSCSIDSL